MILTIVKWPDPILTKKAEDVPYGADCRQLAVDMVETMRAASPAGVGLAAPQVGEGIRLIVGAFATGAWAFSIINPVITKRSEQTMRSVESCLSIPGRQVVVTRAKWVTVEGYDLHWEPVKLKNVRDLMGACLQHEIEHLDGVTIMEHLPKLRVI